MGRVLSKEEAQYVDQQVELHQIPLGYVMENAGAGVARTIMQQGSHFVLFVCGTGNNGADGLVAARHLVEQQQSVQIIIQGNMDTASALFKQQYAICTALNMPVISSSEQADWTAITDVVECISGTGFHGELRPAVKDLFQQIEHQCEIFGCRKWSIDIPAGVEANTGRVADGAWKPDCTITLATAKIGMFVYPAKAVIGDVVTQPLGIPWQQFLQNNTAFLPTFTLDQDFAKSIIQPRTPWGHKGTNGHLLVIGGSETMVGAPAMTCMGAVRTGCGKTTATIIEEKMSVFQTNLLPEVMVQPYSANSAAKQWLEMATQLDVVALGPGLGRSEESISAVRDFVTTYQGKLVIDADGLYALGNVQSQSLKNHQASYILTPHLGEFSRLTGYSIDEIKAQYIDIARHFAQTHQVVLVLKGVPSLVALPNGEVYINTSGNEGMGIGGMGDVLTGVIASLWAQGYSAANSAILGTYLHSAAADRLHHHKIWGYTPSEVTNEIGYVITELLKNK